MRFSRRTDLPAAFTLALALSGCGVHGAGTALPPGVQAAARRPATSPIQHIVIVIQENRSFDNLFARFPGADGATEGKNYNGETIKLVAHGLESHLVLNNEHAAWKTDYDGGKMDGFGLVYVNGRRCTCAYQYVRKKDIVPYWDLASQYVLADHLFQTQSSGSFTAHQDLIRGDTAINDHQSLIDFPTDGPWGCDAPPSTVTSLLDDTGKYLRNKGPFPCLTYATLRDLLDAKGVTWKFYTPSLTNHAGHLWDAFDAIHAVRYGNEWHANVISPETRIFKDIANHKLPNVSWVIPDGQNSDHSGIGPFGFNKDTGPSWVAQVVNAVGGSEYWQSSAIIVVWDDWGGWYDHEAPPQLDYEGLGFRVPMIVVSPYAASGVVSHTQYEFGSILRFVEDTFDLGRLGTTDVRATSIGDVFNYRQRPRRFTHIRANYSKSYFERQKPSNLPVDNS
ncbi:MAG TPA: alkaline phosphatase family protein, partial [Candidatus Tumulicola sp.]|nr:alkaline phosphatase family protein [Candidatus Tumulicola sp.]